MNEIRGCLYHGSRGYDQNEARYASDLPYPWALIAQLAVGLADLNLTVGRSLARVFSPVNLSSSTFSVSIPMPNVFDLQSARVIKQRNERMMIDALMSFSVGHVIRYVF